MSIDSSNFDCESKADIDAADNVHSGIDEAQSSDEDALAAHSEPFNLKELSQMDACDTSSANVNVWSDATEEESAVFWGTDETVSSFQSSMPTSDSQERTIASPANGCNVSVLERLESTSQDTDTDKTLTAESQMEEGCNNHQPGTKHVRHYDVNLKFGSFNI